MVDVFAPQDEPTMTIKNRFVPVVSGLSEDGASVKLTSI